MSFADKFYKVVDKVLMKPKKQEGETVKVLNPDRIGKKRFNVAKGVRVYCYDLINDHLERIDHLSRVARVQFFKDKKLAGQLKGKFLMIRAINETNAKRKVDRFYQLNPNIIRNS